MKCRFSFWKYQFLGVVVMLFGPLYFVLLQDRMLVFLALYGILISLFIFSIAHGIVHKNSLIIEDGYVVQYFPLATKKFAINDYENYIIKKSMLGKTISAQEKKTNNSVVLIGNSYNCSLEDILDELNKHTKS